MDIKISPDELIEGLQQQVTNLVMQITMQDIIIRKLQEGGNAATEEAEDGDKDSGSGAAGSDEGYV